MGHADVIDLDGDGEYGELSVGNGVDFSWSLAGATKLATDLAASLNHPVPSNVVEAARELWFALIQEAARV